MYSQSRPFNCISSLFWKKSFFQTHNTEPNGNSAEIISSLHLSAVSAELKIKYNSSKNNSSSWFLEYLKRKDNTKISSVCKYLLITKIMM